MTQNTAIPPSVAAPLIPPVPVVQARLFEAMNDVKLLKQLLKLAESAERTVGIDVVGLTPQTQSLASPAHASR